MPIEISSDEQDADYRRPISSFMPKAHSQPPNKLAPGVVTISLRPRQDKATEAADETVSERSTSTQQQTVGALA